MNKKHSKWTESDDAVVVDFIKKYPANFTLAFKQAAIKLGRTESSVSGHYYSKLRGADTIIAIGSEKGIMSNTKVVPFKGDENTNTRKTMLLAMFGSMDPAVVIETFLNLLTMDEQKSLFKRSIAKLV